MGFSVSPDVTVSEYDLTTVVPAVSTTVGGVGGVFRWGPIGKLVLVDSENTLNARFGKPTSFNAETYFSAANFLAYGNALYVSRAANTTSTNADIGTWTAVAANAYTLNTIFNVINSDDYEMKYDDGDFVANTNVLFMAKYPGEMGNSLKVSVVDTPAAYSSNVANVSTTSFSGNVMTVTFDDAGYVAANAAYQALTNGDILKVGNSTVGYQSVKISSKGSQPNANTMTLNLEGNYTLSSSVSMSGNVARSWEYSGSVSGAPGTSDYTYQFGNTAAVDEVHVVVSDELGKFTGVPGTILEVYQGLSRATDAKTADGATNYYVNVINQSSKYIWFGNHVAGASYANTATNIASASRTTPNSIQFTGGNDGFDETEIGDHIGPVTNAYDLFASPEDVSVSLLICGKASGTNDTQLANYLIDNIAEVRKDCVVFVSPARSDVVNNYGSEAESVVAFRNNLRSSSYAVMDSGYKYQYDKYNDVYRYIPLNGDIAGLCVNTDNVRDPWWSPAGLNRGQIKNVVKLAWNPKKDERDLLYINGVNPVTTFPGNGTVLFGDKTLLAKPSAFDRINVRRLFIVLEKSISTAAKYQLFDYNDTFSRAQFVSLINPYLADIKGRRGIYDFKVVCDETNNTAEVIDSYRFVGDIYIKPARSTNWVQLNFAAVRTGVDFNEIVGSFS